VKRIGENVKTQKQFFTKIPRRCEDLKAEILKSKSNIYIIKTIKSGFQQKRACIT